MVSFLTPFCSNLSEILQSPLKFKPFPTIIEREKWEQIDPTIKKAYIALAEPYLDFQWPSLPATLYGEFKENGNRNHFETPYFLRRHALGCLTIAECVEGKGLQSSIYLLRILPIYSVYVIIYWKKLFQKNLGLFWNGLNMNSKSGFSMNTLMMIHTGGWDSKEEK
jgi:hypothetical protein